MLPDVAEPSKSNYAVVMAENELSIVKLSAPPLSRLTVGEKRDLDRAEKTIARGLRSFLEVGMALKEIRNAALSRAFQNVRGILRPALGLHPDTRLPDLRRLGGRRGFVNSC